MMVVELVLSGECLYFVGRLDVDMMGLILFINDGELVHTFMYLSFEVLCIYWVWVCNVFVKESVLRTLCEGVELEDGMVVSACVRWFGFDYVELMIHEGCKC